MSKCINCDKEYVPKNSRQKFCSIECNNYYKYVGAGKAAKNERVRTYRAKRLREEGPWRKNGPKGQQLATWYENIKSNPCLDCGKCFVPICMEFDHKLGEDKRYNVAEMVSHNYSKEKIEIEIAKCELVCSVCHRIRTWKALKDTYECIPIKPDFYLRNCFYCTVEFKTKRADGFLCGDKCRYKMSRESQEVKSRFANVRQEEKNTRPKFKDKNTYLRKKFIDSLKDTPCSDCGIKFDSYCMDFDHVAGVKIDAISNMRHSAVSKETVDEEISKCEVVCANCHRLRTKKRQQEKVLGEYVPRNKE